jgi:demethylmenaquinone methyltransferase/2-methoxy-6-polyprenyl-1,4-benzoquinol methylase
MELEDLRAMFASLAPRYDFLNHLLSFNADRLWRRRLVTDVPPEQIERALDLCTGTGEVAIRLAKTKGISAEIVGLDCSPEMLRVARRRVAELGLQGRINLCEGEALSLPFLDRSFDLVTVAFGLRNLPDWKGGLEEIFRVLTPGGRVRVLEFSLPRRWPLSVLYRVYLSRVLPLIGGLLSGSFRAYNYLASSIIAFPQPREVLQAMERIGFKGVEATFLLSGVAVIYSGYKDEFSLA